MRVSLDLTSCSRSRYLSDMAAPLPTPVPNQSLVGGLPTGGAALKKAAETIGMPHVAEEVYHINLSLFFAGRAFGWSLADAAGEVMLGQARAGVSIAGADGCRPHGKFFKDYHPAPW